MPPRIAIVEDNFTFLHHFKLWLADIFQTSEVHGYNNAENSVQQALLEGDFDIVILDIALVDRPFGGIDLATALIKQRLETQKLTPIIIMLSASINTNDVKMCEDIGVEMVEPKPLRKSGLKDLLIKCSATNNWLPESSVKNSCPQSENQIQISTQLTQGCNVFRVGEPDLKGHLPPKQLLILQRLLEDSPQPVSFKQLYKSVGWSEEEAQESLKSRLEHHISKLREFLRDNIYTKEEYERIPIKTRLANVHGVGFVWKNI